MADLTPTRILAATGMPHANVSAELVRIHAYLSEAKPLEPEAAKVLYDNLWELYEP